MDEIQGGKTQQHEGAEALTQAAQRGCGCPVPGSAPGQAGGTFGHPDLVEDVFAHGMGLERESLEGPFLPKPFCYSMIFWF